MDVLSFIRFSFNRHYIVRWIVAGLLFFIPVINFFSLGYLWRTATQAMVGGMGLPTWERKKELWKEGARLLYVVILYEALPSFLFSLGFLVSSPGNTILNAVGWVLQVLSIIAFIACSFLLPFAFCAFAEKSHFSGAFELHPVLRKVKSVLVHYVAGCLVAGFCLYVALRLRAIPYVGIFLVSILVFYVFLVSVYYFSDLHQKASLPETSKRNGVVTP
jgi:hypothetical protein